VERKFVVSLQTSRLVKNRGTGVRINQEIVEIRGIVKNRKLRPEETRGNRREPGKKPGSKKPVGNVETVTVPKEPESFLGRGDGFRRSRIDQLLAP
jgi:hypothetical protein